MSEMIGDDLQLLREYAERGSEAAFVALVARHVNLVYSVALRQTRDPHLAQEITQNVFIILARKANSLPSNTVVAGWLCRTARFVSKDVLKVLHRRQKREQEAHMHSKLLESNSAEWDQVAPLLDEGLSRLAGKEHDALVLRFFGNKDLKEVGAALGLTEDAARMRINRAVAKLRAFFLKNGVTVSGTALSSAIAANSVQAAPAGLAAIVATGVFSGVSITAAVAASISTVAMTTFQKIAVAGTVAVLAGLGVYEVRHSAQLSARLELQERQHADQIDQWRRQYEEASNRLVFATQELGRARKDSSELLRLRDEVGRLKKQAQSTPALSEAAEEDNRRVPFNIPPVRTLYTFGMVNAAWDQPIATGGWKTPSGKRALVIANASRVGQSQVTIKTCVVEYSDDAGIACGLDSFNTDEQAVNKAAPITTEQIEKLKTLEGVAFVTAPVVTTLDGRQVKVQVTDEHSTPSGEKYSTGPIIDAIPTISPDGQGVQMMFSAHLNLENSPAK